MPFWAWIALGAALLATEMFVIDAAFYLFFLGAAALLVAALAPLGVPVAAQWVVFAITSVVFMVLFRQKLYQKLRGGLPGFEDKSMGKSILISEELAPGATTRVEHRGTSWTAKNVDESAIPAGTHASIHAIDGLTVHLKNPN